MTTVLAGGYTGMVACGLLAVITGQAFSQVPQLPGVIVVLGLMGAFAALIVALVSRKRLAPNLHHRILKFVCIGLVSFPIAVASSGYSNENVMTTILLSGVAGGFVVHLVRRFRYSHR
jgi:di/tricarboxylate transporter